jgi:hypothetical protein
MALHGCLIVYGRSVSRVQVGQIPEHEATLTRELVLPQNVRRIYALICHPFASLPPYNKV